MKRVLLLLLLFANLSANAQDFVIMRNGKSFSCKVKGINEGYVYFQRGEDKKKAKTNRVYMIKYETRGNAFFNSNGEVSYNSDASSVKQSKSDIAIYLCEGVEIITPEIKMTGNNIEYKEPKNGLKKVLGVFSKKGDWASISRDKVFIIRYGDGTKDIITPLTDQTATVADVKRPFIPTSDNESLPCPAEVKLKDGKVMTVVLYDMDTDYIHYRRKEWQDGPIFRMEQSKIADVSY